MPEIQNPLKLAADLADANAVLDRLIKAEAEVSRLQSVASEIEALKAEVASKDETIAGLEAKVDAMIAADETPTALQASYVEAKAELDAVIDTQAAEIVALTEAAATSVAEIESLKSAIEMLEVERDTHASRATAAELDRDALKTQIATLNEALGAGSYQAEEAEIVDEDVRSEASAADHVYDEYVALSNARKFREAAAMRRDPEKAAIIDARLLAKANGLRAEGSAAAASVRSAAPATAGISDEEWTKYNDYIALQMKANDRRAWASNADREAAKTDLRKFAFANVDLIERCRLARR